MISELVVDVQPKEVSIAVLEDKSLVELQKEARNVSFAVGDIYLGKVKKLQHPTEIFKAIAERSPKGAGTVENSDSTGDRKEREY